LEHAETDQRLVIDNDPQIRRALRVGLERNRYRVVLAATGEEGLDRAALHPPDVVILDPAMSGVGGFEVCRQLRNWSRAPIIALSGRAGEAEKIRSLDMGADDCLTKPFSMEELLARLRAVLRRARSGEEPAVPTLMAGALEINFARRRVRLAGQAVRLTPTEFELLRHLAQNADRVPTHSQLLMRVWGWDYAEGTHTLRVHIANLRGKIEPDPTRPQWLLTEPRVGYRFHTGPRPEVLPLFHQLPNEPPGPKRATGATE
jgi:two-component system KDP operon response regulator KdpE